MKIILLQNATGIEITGTQGPDSNNQVKILLCLYDRDDIEWLQCMDILYKEILCEYMHTYVCVII